MYGRIANYAPAAMPDALSTYYQTGMGAVLSPEALVAGEDFARTAGQMRGLGQPGAVQYELEQQAAAAASMALQAQQREAERSGFWKGLAVGIAAGALAGRAAAWVFGR